MFRESLQRVVDRVDGGMAGVLMGFDGISVEAYSRPRDATDAGTDITTVGMEFAHVLTQMRRAAELLEVGGLGEVTLTTEKLAVVVRVLNEEYFLACALAPGGNLGKARYLLRVAAPRIQAEL
jgi:predicted regulator of Ras-like GTPase activity (Roadblock/LC7/MglB family)